MFVSTELDKALQKGYRVLQVFEIWNYHSKETGLFAPYINHFRKGKQQVGGWQKGCDTENKRDRYIKDNFKREGVMLDKSKIGEEKNVPEYNRCKLCLNSFWGKMAESTDRKQTQLIQASEEFFSFLSNEQYVDKKFAIVDEETLVVSYRNEKNFAMPSEKKVPSCTQLSPPPWPD